MKANVVSGKNGKLKGDATNKTETPKIKPTDQIRPHQNRQSAPPMVGTNGIHQNRWCY